MSEDEYRKKFPTKTVHLAGPETAGATIQIAGKTVKLPPDATLDGVLGSASCVPGNQKCLEMELPAVAIKRGNSDILVGLVTGKVNSRTVDPRRPDAFDFLKGVVRE